MITALQKRFLLFLFGCIPTRLLFTYIAKTGSVYVKKISGLIAFIIATGFMYIYLTGSRNTGFETGGAPIWWNNLRPVHSLFYYTFAFMIYFKYYSDAWKVLLLDTMIGLFSFLYFHFKKPTVS
jgi:hypothetical protein